jgi:hypothetical protein
VIVFHDGLSSVMCDFCHLVYSNPDSLPGTQSHEDMALEDGWYKRERVRPAQERDPARPLILLHEGGAKFTEHLCPEHAPA